MAGLQRIRIPRVLATSIVMAAVICTLVVGAYSLRGQMQTILTQLPEAASKLTGGSPVCAIIRAVIFRMSNPPWVK